MAHPRKSSPYYLLTRLASRHPATRSPIEILFILVEKPFLWFRRSTPVDFWTHDYLIPQLRSDNSSCSERLIDQKIIILVVVGGCLVHALTPLVVSICYHWLLSLTVLHNYSILLLLLIIEPC
jgi:hypothetical protein